MKLTAKQRRFIDEYFKCNMNGTRAAIAAGYSERTACAIGAENLRKPLIAAEIERRLAESTASANEVLARLTEQARGDYSPYLTESGVDLRALLADGKGHLVKKIKEGQNGVDVEFYDSQAALVQLGKFHKLFTEKTEVTGKDGEAIELSIGERARRIEAIFDAARERRVGQVVND